MGGGLGTCRPRLATTVQQNVMDRAPDNERLQIPRDPGNMKGRNDPKGAKREK